MSDRTREMRALDRFLDDLVRDIDTPAPLGDELPPETVAWARRIVLAEQSHAPDREQESAVEERVWHRITTEMRHSHTSRFVPTMPALFPRVWLRAGLVAACVLVAAAVSFSLWMGQAPTVSAQEIIEKARATVDSPAAGGVQSFVLNETRRTIPASPRMRDYAGLKEGQQLVTETKHWYQAPGHWRTESAQKIVGPDGKGISRPGSIQVSDGKDLWIYDAGANLVNVNVFDPGMNGKEGVSAFGEDVADLKSLFEQASTCFDAKVTGSATVAGRGTYIIDLGPTKCPSASGPEMNGRLVIWVDKETFFVLKQEQHSVEGSIVVLASEVTQIAYNVSIDPAMFTFTPPAGATVADNRPKPAPSADQFRQQLEQLAKQVDFPVLVPAYVSQGLAPRQPKIDPMMGNLVEISYFPTSEPDKDSLASMAKGLTLREQRATTDLVSQWIQGAEPISIGGNKGWLRRGVRHVDNTGSDSAALVLRDGVLVSIASFTIAPEELVKVAVSLQTVPGAHAALPNPDLGKIGEQRPQPTATLPPLKYTILRPGWLPEALTAREQRDGDIVTLGFDPRPNDAPHDVLTLREMPKAMISPGGIPDPQQTLEQIGGHAVTIVKRGQNCITLTWEVGSLQLTLTNPYDPPGHPRYSCDQLRKIVESVH